MERLRLQIKDPWKDIRDNICFGNIEPKVELVGCTYIGDRDPNNLQNTVECLPAISASISYGSRIDTIEKAISLNKNLIKRGHLTPLESVQFNFKVTGISKICGAQLSRHRIGQGHVSGSRRFRKQGNLFVYPLLDYIEDQEQVENIYRVMSSSIEDSINCLNQLIQETIGVKKSDARYLVPASTATARYWWINARALRDFFRLRLAADAEWEIRRLAFIVLELVLELTPSLFEDIYEQNI